MTTAEGRHHAADMRKPDPKTPPIREAAKSRSTGQTAKLPAPRRRSIWATVLLTLPALGVTAALFFLVERPERLCRQWEQAAHSADEASAEQLVAQLDRYGNYGLPAVVRLLKSENEAAMLAASRALTARFVRWNQFASPGDREALTMVADEFHRQFAGDDQPVAREAAACALELLAATGRLGLAEQINDELRSRLLAACDEVLRRAPPPLVAPAIPLLATIPLSPPDEPELDREPAIVASPVKAAPVVATVEPQPVPMPPVLTPPTPQPAANAAARINPVREPSTDAAVRPASLTPSISSAKRQTEDDLAAAKALERADAWTLFGALRTEDRDIAAALLRQRGFSKPEIELGEHLTSDDPKERRSYIRQLPALGVTEAKPWLLRLCRDEDAEVRRIAVTIMATTNDPAVQDLLRQLALEDADDEVRRTAGRATGRIR